MNKLSYEEWLKYGDDKDYFSRYIKNRDDKIKEVKKQLDRAYTPKIKSMLSKKVQKEMENE